MRLYSFENLEVWKLSRELKKLIYKITDKFPKDEKFCLVSQMHRASISVSSNIAEGTSRKSAIEQARFAEIAIGSLLEVLNQHIIVRDLGYINELIKEEARSLIEELGNKLNKLKEIQVKRYHDSNIK